MFKIFISANTKYEDLAVWSRRGLCHWVVQPNAWFPDSALAFIATAEPLNVFTTSFNK